MIRTWALLRWCSTKRRYIKCTYLYLYLYPSAINLPQPTLTTSSRIYRASACLGLQSAILLLQIRVCPLHLSIRRTPVLYANECTYRQTLLSTIWWENYFSFFSSATAVTKFQRKLSYRGVRYKGWEIAIFDKLQFISETVRDRPISFHMFHVPQWGLSLFHPWRHRQLGPWLLWNTNRKSHSRSKHVGSSDLEWPWKARYKGLYFSGGFP